jgi:phasin family protein
MWPQHWQQAANRPGKALTFMVKNFEDMQKLGKDNMDATLTSLGVWSKGFQTIAVEMADYTKKMFEDGTAATEKLLGAKSLDKAIEVQSDYVKSSYENFVAQATKFGELYAGLAQEAYKPFESYMAKAGVK